MAAGTQASCTPEDAARRILAAIGARAGEKLIKVN